MMMEFRDRKIFFGSIASSVRGIDHGVFSSVGVFFAVHIYEELG